MNRWNKDSQLPLTSVVKELTGGGISPPLSETGGLQPPSPPLSYPVPFIRCGIVINNS